MFGTDVISDWKVGSPIVYKGDWQGKPFEDKGKSWLLSLKNFWSARIGPHFPACQTCPENYHTVTYRLSESDGKTEVTIHQDKNASEEEKAEFRGKLEGYFGWAEEASGRLNRNPFDRFSIKLRRIDPRFFPGDQAAHRFQKIHRLSLTHRLFELGCSQVFF